MANKGGTLANLGQALAGYGSALSGNPMYLQNSLLLRQAQQQQADRAEAKQREAMRSEDLAELNRRAAQGNPNFLGPRTIEGQLFGRQAMGAEELLGRANPEAAAKLAMEKLGMGMAPSKDDFIGTPGEGGIYNWRTRQMVPGTTIPKERTPDGQWAIRAGDGKPQFVSKQSLLDAPNAFLPVPTGMRIMSDGQGGFQITTGGMDPVEMTTPTKSKLEDTILTGRDALARIRGIETKFKPEYQQLGTRWNNTWANIKDKAGIPLDAATRTQLEDFSSYRRETSANLNQTIKDITGATVSEQEAPRLMQQIPNAGSGLFDGDGPTEFQAKVKGTRDSISAAIARAEYARKNGLSRQQQFAIPLDSVPQLIDQKGNQYREELKRANPSAPDEQINEMVKARLRQEFGL